MTARPPIAPTGRRDCCGRMHLLTMLLLPEGCIKGRIKLILVGEELGY
ncbi:MAG: hypothetical protein ACLTDV_00830 [Eubacterium sp.]